MRLAIVLLMCSTAFGQQIDHKIAAKVRSCEKRNWPVTDPTCHGYALPMAHEYYAEHKELFEPSAPVISTPLIAEWSTSNAVIIQGPVIPSSPWTGDTTTATVCNGVFVNGVCTIDGKPPLTCGKYQHVYHWSGACGPSQCDNFSCYASCSPVPPDECVADMHEVTEREWQELMERIKKLENAHDGKS